MCWTHSLLHIGTVSYTTDMSKRLQVVLEEAELARYEHTATAAGLTLSEWVRQTLRAAEQRRSPGDAHAKLAAVRRAVAYGAAPAPDIDQMLREIEVGYSSSAP